MSVLMSLRSDVWQYILSEWLDLIDWGVFDTALSCKKFRSVMLQLYRELSYSSLELHAFDSKVLAWVYLRGIKLISLVLHYNDDVDESGANVLVLDENYFCSYSDSPFTVSLADITSLRDQSRSIPVLSALAIIQSCPNLIALASSVPALFFSSSKSILECLTSVSLLRSHEANESSTSGILLALVAIRQYCRRLTTFKLYVGEQHTDACEDIVKVNPNLRNISLKSTSDNILQVISDHCSDLEHLDITFSECDFSKLTPLITNCKALSRLAITDSHAQCCRFTICAEGIKSLVIEVQQETSNHQMKSVTNVLSELDSVEFKAVSGMSINVNALSKLSSNTLKSLTCTDCCISPESLSHQLTCCNKLQRLELYGDVVPSQSLLSVFSHLNTSLTEIVIVDATLTIDAVTQILRHYHLHKCRLSWLIDVTTESSLTELMTIMKGKSELVCNIKLKIKNSSRKRSLQYSKGELCGLDGLFN